VTTTVTYALEGRTVSSDEFFAGIAGGGRQSAVQQMTANIESVSCLEHGGQASVAEVDQTEGGFGFTIAGCCDELIDRAHDSAASYAPVP
jgi:putative hemolysin